MELLKMTSSQDSGRRVLFWQEPSFLIFWGGQSLSNLGDAFALVALPLLVLQVTGSVAQMGLLTATFGAGRLLAGVFVGFVVDRIDRRKFMILCDTSRLLLYGSIPCTWLFSGAQLWLVYIVVAVGAVIGMSFQVAYVTAVANLVEINQLTAANSLLQGTLSLTYVLDPLLAGMVALALGPTTAIGVDAFTFGISALSLTQIRFRPSSKELSLGDFCRPPSPTVCAQIATPRYVFAEMLAGPRYLWKHPVLHAVILLRAGMALVLLSGGASGTLDLFVFHLTHDLHQPATAVGLVLGFASIGGIGGALLAPALRKWLGFGLCWLGGSALAGLVAIGGGLAPTIGIIAPMTILFTFGCTLGSISVLSLRQELTPDELLGRVSAAFTLLSTIASAVGAILITNLATHLGTLWSLCLAGGWVVGLAVLGFFTSGNQHSPERCTSRVRVACRPNSDTLLEEVHP